MREQRLTNRFPIQRNVLHRSRGRSAMGEVCDVSLTGLRMKGSTNLEVGAPVTLKVLGPTGATLKEVRCVVQWHSVREDGSRESGLSFLIPISELVQSWVGEILRELENKAAQLLQRRRSIRTAVRIPLTVATEDAPVYAEFVELSEGGAILRSNRVWQSGETIELRANLAGRVVTLSATVIRNQPAFVSSRSQSDHSLRFESLDGETQRNLSRAVGLALRKAEALAA